jgi:hypothetical protein
METKTIIIICVVIGIIIFLTGMYAQKKVPIFSITGNEVVARSAPTNVNPGSTFTLTYTVNSASGIWGNSISDSVSGGCTFPSGQVTYKSVMLSDDGNTKSITITAPSSGQCTFTGDYQFGNYSVKSMSNTIVNICTPLCTRPTNLCLTSSSNGCGGTCSWTISQLNTDDTDCDNKISRTELGTAINGWINGQISRNQLGADILSWSQN